MRLSGILLLTCALAAGCGGDDSPSTPSTTTPNTVTFTATLLPANELAPNTVTNAESSGRGTAVITFNLTRNTAGAIQSGTVDFHYDLTGFPAGTTITLSHIHTGAATVSGPVLINTSQSAATVLGLPNGSGSWESRGNTAGADAATLQSIIDNPAGFYFNVHSSTNPSGVARGQLVKQ